MARKKKEAEKKPTNQEAAAQRRRARRLHAQIDGLVGPSKAQPTKEIEQDRQPVQRRNAPRVRPTPRQFIHRRMRELAEAESDRNEVREQDTDPNAD